MHLISYQYCFTRPKTALLYHRSFMQSQTACGIASSFIGLGKKKGKKIFKAWGAFPKATNTQSMVSECLSTEESKKPCFITDQIPFFGEGKLKLACLQTNRSVLTLPKKLLTKKNGESKTYRRRCSTAATIQQYTKVRSGCGSICSIRLLIIQYLIICDYFTVFYVQLDADCILPYQF